MMTEGIKKEAGRRRCTYLNIMNTDSTSVANHHRRSYAPRSPPAGVMWRTSSHVELGRNAAFGAISGSERQARSTFCCMTTNKHARASYFSCHFRLLGRTLSGTRSDVVVAGIQQTWLAWHDAIPKRFLSDERPVFGGCVFRTVRGC